MGLLLKVPAFTASHQPKCRRHSCGNPGYVRGTPNLQTLHEGLHSLYIRYMKAKLSGDKCKVRYQSERLPTAKNNNAVLITYQSCKACYLKWQNSAQNSHGISWHRSLRGGLGFKGQAVSLLIILLAKSWLRTPHLLLLALSLEFLEPLAIWLLF